MPGRLILNSPISAVFAALPNIPPYCGNEPARHNIQPGQDILVATRQGFQKMRWGIIPVGRVNARGRPVMETIINARSETIFEKSAFQGVTRGVIPADGWYEWTGEKRRKQPWRISRTDRSLLWFAAICDVWIGPSGINLPQAAAVTCAPNADVKDIHHRMGILLEPDTIPLWLNPDPEIAKTALVQPAAGKLIVEKADDVDWSRL